MEFACVVCACCLCVSICVYVYVCVFVCVCVCVWCRASFVFSVQEQPDNDFCWAWCLWKYMLCWFDIYAIFTVPSVLVWRTQSIRFHLPLFCSRISLYLWHILVCLCHFQNQWSWTWKWIISLHDIKYEEDIKKEEEEAKKKREKEEKKKKRRDSCTNTKSDSPAFILILSFPASHDFLCSCHVLLRSCSS